MTPFTPITREQAAAILSVSLSTLDAMIAAESIPEPRALPGGRRKYWHPDIFYTWLDQQLREQRPTDDRSSPLPPPPPSRASGRRPTTPLGVAERTRARDTARLAALNSGDAD